MLIKDIGENSYPKQNMSSYDDEFLSSLQIDSDVPMSLENTLDFSLLEDNSPDDIVSHVMSDFDIKSLPTYDDFKFDPMPDFPDMITDANELNFFNNYINPDDFLNDVKVEIKSEVNSPNRDTPSPSSGSSDFNSFISSKSNASTQSKDTYSYINALDTPPISPPSSLTPPPLSPQPFLLNPPTTSGIKIVQGTLIPIKTVPISTATTSKIVDSSMPMKKIRIHPKPVMIGGVNKAANKKTIILSAQDFSALVQKVKSLKDTTETPSIILKSTNNNQIIKREPTVLPKSNIISTTTKPIIPAISRTVSNNNNNNNNISNSNSSFVYDYDEKTMKKQQRMIKNRESACLSRKKKKEYVTSLENKISQLSMENMSLKTENSILKKSLSEKNTLCNCKKLNAVPALLKTTTARKSSAVFLAVLFMVSINIGSFGLFNTIRDSSLNSTQILSKEKIIHHSRGLLWVDQNDYNNNESVLFFENATSTTSNNNIYPICPMFVNQTESIRLASELRRWIGEPDYFNLSTSKINNNSNFHIKSFSELLVPDNSLKNMFEQMKDMKSNVKTKSRRKLRSIRKAVAPQSSDLLPYKDSNHLQVFNPSNNAIKYAEFFEEIRRRDDTFYVVSFSGDHLLLPALAHNKTLRPKMALMLPTVGVNDSFSNGFVTLMQIDCEVINTSILRVREKFIPDNLRNTNKVQEEQRSNNNNSNTPKRSGNRRHNQATQIQKQDYHNHHNISGKLVPNNIKHNYKPYFIDKTINNKDIYQSNNIDYTP